MTTTNGREEAISEALQSRDSDKLRALADDYSEEGDTEYAETLRFAAKKIDTEDLDDQARADKAEREIERAEEHYHPAEGNE